MRFRALTLGLTLGGLLADSWVVRARGDGGTLRLWERQGRYEIAVFTAPSPVVSGPVDISVLVLDSASGEPVPDANVSIEVAPMARPGEALRQPATTGAATNKLLRAAVFELGESGFWSVEVTIGAVQPEAKVRFTLEAGGARARWIVLWPW